MIDGKKTGKASLRAVDGRKATGVCQYSVDSSGAEISVSAQVFDGGGALTAVLQSGPEKDYMCRPPAGLGGTIRCGGAGVMAVWVLDGFMPVLFGQLIPGDFDLAQARKHLPGMQEKQEELPLQQSFVSMKSVPSTAMAEPEIPIEMPSFRAPEPEKPAAPFQPPEPVLLLQPGPQPAPQSAQPQPAQPLVVRRAPRPTPRPPVYSPLWDDVSAEFEKMLDNLPSAKPFGGNAESARFAEMPLAGAVQCYIGSVEIKGMKVFLQAVPARPFARPAGFDHSLVSRDGESYWVKYFIQD